MYLIPLLVIIFLSLIAMAWGSPIFAIIIFAVLFLLFLAYIGVSRRADQQATTPEGRAAERGRREEAEAKSAQGSGVRNRDPPGSAITVPSCSRPRTLRRDPSRRPASASRP